MNERPTRLQSLQPLYQLLDYQLKTAITALGPVNPAQEPKGYVDLLLKQQRLTFEELQHYWTLLNIRRLLRDIYGATETTEAQT